MWLRTVLIECSSIQLLNEYVLAIHVYKNTSNNFHFKSDQDRGLCRKFVQAQLRICCLTISEPISACGQSPV